jgi:hypothetical protein
MNSSFTFLQAEWPRLHKAASKAEALTHADPRAAQRALLVELDALFASLQRRAFRGEL